MTEGFVYFIQCDGDYGPVKVGWALDPIKRRGELAIANPYPLRLIGFLGGSQELERQIHRELDGWMHGEWFYLTPRLREWIAEASEKPPIGIEEKCL